MGEVREGVARAERIAAPRTLRHLASERRQRLARARPKQKPTAGKQPAPLRTKKGLQRFLRSHLASERKMS